MRKGEQGRTMGKEIGNLHKFSFQKPTTCKSERKTAENRELNRWSNSN
jgi:hypothetical protein